MRSASSYRSARRKAARDIGSDWDKFQDDYWSRRARALGRMETQALNMTPAQAREALARWARNPQRDVVSVTELMPPKPEEK